MKKKKIKPKEENKSTPDVVEKPQPPPVIERPVQVPIIINEEEKPLISQQPSARTWRGKKTRGDD